MPLDTGRGNTATMDFRQVELIRVFECDPDLLLGVDERVAAHLRRRGAARRLMVPAGPWEAPEQPDSIGDLGLLLIEGLVVRSLTLAGREGSEILGPGDVLRPWDDETPNVPVSHESSWRALQPTVFAVLDERFMSAVARWPSITSQLLSRSIRRCRGLVFQATVAHVRHAETRVLLMLWHLADRWGRVTPEGVVMPVSLTQELLAQLTSLRRPTVSHALGRLVEAKRIERIDGGGWLLHDDEPPRETPHSAGTLAAA